MIKRASSITRRGFLKTFGIFAGTALISPFPVGRQGHANNTKQWKVAIVKDKSKQMFGLHGMHVAFRGIPDVEVIGLVDGNTSNIEEKLAQTQAARHYLNCESLLKNEKPDIVVLTSRLPGDHLEQIRFTRIIVISTAKTVDSLFAQADEIIQIGTNKLKSPWPSCRNGLGFVQ